MVLVDPLSLSHLDPWERSPWTSFSNLQHWTPRIQCICMNISVHVRVSVSVCTDIHPYVVWLMTWFLQIKVGPMMASCSSWLQFWKHSQAVRTLQAPRRNRLSLIPCLLDRREVEYDSNTLILVLFWCTSVRHRRKMGKYKHKYDTGQMTTGIRQ